MMQTKPWIKKDHPDLPDNYSLNITYVTGREESYEIAEHHYFPVGYTTDKQGNILGAAPAAMFEWCTIDDKWFTVPVTSILFVTFDKRWSKVVALRQNLAKEAKK